MSVPLPGRPPVGSMLPPHGLPHGMPPHGPLGMPMLPPGLPFAPGFPPPGFAPHGPPPGLLPPHPHGMPPPPGMPWGMQGHYPGYPMPSAPAAGRPGDSSKEAKKKDKEAEKSKDEHPAKKKKKAEKTKENDRSAKKRRKGGKKKAASTSSSESPVESTSDDGRPPSSDDDSGKSSSTSSEDTRVRKKKAKTKVKKKAKTKVPKKKAKKSKAKAKEEDAGEAAKARKVAAEEALRMLPATPVQSAASVPMSMLPNGSGWGSQAEVRGVEKAEFLPLPRVLIGRIIGKSGSTIKDIREKTGAHVEARDQSQDPVQVLVTGTSQAVEAAKAMLLDIAEGAAFLTGDALPPTPASTGTAGKAAVTVAATAPEKQPAAASAAPMEQQASSLPPAGTPGGLSPPRERRRPRRFEDAPPAELMAGNEASLGSNAVPSRATPDEALMEELLELPKQSAGKVIGAKGQQISEVRQQSGAQVDVDKTDTGCSVRLLGTRRQIDVAKALIARILDPAAAGSMPAEDMVEIPKNSVGRVIGAGGARIQEMQEKSGAKIDIDRSVPDRVFVRFVGPEEAVANAKFLVQEVLAGRDRTNAGDSTVVLEVAPNTTGRLIGPGGRQINDIQDRSGAKVDIDKSRDPCTVRIVGSPEAVSLAQQMVLAVVAQIPPKGGRSQAASSASGARAGDECITFDVPADLVERVLANNWIASVQRKTGVRVNVKRTELGCELELLGQPEQVIEAEGMAEAAVRSASALAAAGEPLPVEVTLRAPPPPPPRPAEGSATLLMPPMAGSAWAASGPGRPPMPPPAPPPAPGAPPAPAAAPRPMPTLTTSLRPSLAGGHMLSSGQPPPPTTPPPPLTAVAPGADVLAAGIPLAAAATPGFYGAPGMVGNPAAVVAAGIAAAQAFMMQQAAAAAVASAPGGTPPS
eukprot:TRINITY_DN56247_c0_g1_i1.p1 TRINITY_DN56247_c0_g1~~TRINITY_DN56247_c0_g1_i1.p1  ORF type:complete len:918 (-),score=275.89 TRINITY_DN56247_c0_g1_i1:64-2817(-)